MLNNAYFGKYFEHCSHLFAFETIFSDLNAYGFGIDLNIT
jgi:hypothetical protein